MEKSICTYFEFDINVSYGVPTNGKETDQEFLSYLKNEIAIAMVSPSSMTIAQTLNDDFLLSKKTLADIEKSGRLVNAFKLIAVSMEKLTGSALINRFEWFANKKDDGNLFKYKIESWAYKSSNIFQCEPNEYLINKYFKLDEPESVNKLKKIPTFYDDIEIFRECSEAVKLAALNTKLWFLVLDKSPETLYDAEKNGSGCEPQLALRHCNRARVHENLEHFVNDSNLMFTPAVHEIISSHTHFDDALSALFDAIQLRGKQNEVNARGVSAPRDRSRHLRNFEDFIEPKKNDNCSTCFTGTQNFPEGVPTAIHSVGFYIGKQEMLNYNDEKLNKEPMLNVAHIACLSLFLRVLKREAELFIFDPPISHEISGTPEEMDNSAIQMYHVEFKCNLKKCNTTDFAHKSKVIFKALSEELKNIADRNEIVIDGEMYEFT